MTESPNSDQRDHRNYLISFYQRFSLTILTLIGLLLPAVLWMSARVMTPGDMSAYLLDVSHWLPQEELLIRDMERFSEVAGKERSHVIRISWPGCNATDPRLNAFATELREQQWGQSFNSEAPAAKIFDEVLTVDDLIDQWRARFNDLSNEQLDAQLKHVMVGPTGTTCVLATLPTRDPARRAFAIQQIYRVSERIPGLDRCTRTKSTSPVREWLPISPPFPC
jgi:hypothetical protein